MKLLLTNLFSECDVDLFAFTKEVLNNELLFRFFAVRLSLNLIPFVEILVRKFKKMC